MMMIIRNTLLLLPMLWLLNMPSEAAKRRNRAPDVGIMDRIAKKLAITVWNDFVTAIAANQLEYLTLSLPKRERATSSRSCTPFYSTQHIRFGEPVFVTHFQLYSTCERQQAQVLVYQIRMLP